MMTNLKILFMFLFLSVVAFGVTSSHMIIDTGSTTAVTGNVTAVQGTGSNLHVVVDTAPSTAVTGPLTDTQLRASAVPVSLATAPSTPVTGTFYQATQPVSLASAQVASGAFASGSIASGAIASGAIASGAVASGAIASGAVASGAFASGSIVAGAIAAGATSFVKLEDAASADGDAGVPAFAVRKATPANTSGSDGDYEALQISAGRLWTSTTIDTALPAGSAVIGHVIADSGSTTAVTQATGTNLHAVLDTTSTTACTQATGSNLHVQVDTAPSTAVTNAGTFATQSKLVDTAGTNQGTIKAASTLSVATDTSLVVAQVPGGGNPCQNPSSVLVGISGATSTNNATQIIGLSGSTKIYICSMTITGVSGTTPTFSLVTGTGSNCANSQATLVGAWTTAANTLYQFSYMVAISGAGSEVCYKDGGTSPIQNYTITYVQQ